MKMAVSPASATFSKDVRCWSTDPNWHPKYLIEGKGARVKGDDGRWYIEMTSALGANLLGYRHPYLTRKLRYQVKQGIGFTLQHRLEAEAAEKLVTMLGQHVPGWTPDDLQVRWALGGSEACETAVTLARAVTKRRQVVSCLYHGWHSMFTGLTPPAYGVIPDPYMVDVPFGDLSALEYRLNQSATAAFIIEQPPQDPPPGYWKSVRQLCDEYGALLVIDEVVTGMRLARGGLAEWADVRPDLCAYGKALAGSGVPIGCVVGPREYMSRFGLPSPVFVSATGAGNALSMCAASATLDIWNQKAVDRLWEGGNILMAELRRAGYQVIGQAPRFLVQYGSPANRAFFIASMRDKGVLANRPWMVNLAHEQLDIAYVATAAKEIKTEMERVDVEEMMKDKLPMILFEGR